MYTSSSRPFAASNLSCARVCESSSSSSLRRCSREYASKSTKTMPSMTPSVESIQSPACTRKSSSARMSASTALNASASRASCDSAISDSILKSRVMHFSRTASSSASLHSSFDSSETRRSGVEQPQSHRSTVARSKARCLRGVASHAMHVQASRCATSNAYAASTFRAKQASQNARSQSSQQKSVPPSPHHAQASSSCSSTSS
mmetsp:Transcript_5227/g.18529  ORF Transcript_5227/g.18529 Transcript_5227/m.18529 type:complete len:204 (+) Transcript_5227:1234-1845(+)